MKSGYIFFFFKQKTAYEMRISDWSSDVCSSDLHERGCGDEQNGMHSEPQQQPDPDINQRVMDHEEYDGIPAHEDQHIRSEEHTSELQSLMHISYAVFCLKKKKTNERNKNNNPPQQQKSDLTCTTA